MTADPVTADMLAEALREAHRVVVSIMTLTGLSEICVNDHRYVDVDESEYRWQGILDRYDAQCREGIEKQVAVESEDMQSSMWRARFWRDRQRHEDKDRNVAIARAANHRILHLRRELERHTNGTH